MLRADSSDRDTAIPSLILLGSRPARLLAPCVTGPEPVRFSRPVAAQELFKFKLDMLSLAGSGGLGPDRGRAAEALTGWPLTPGRAAPGREPHIR
jgi:hypothetical protein